MLFCFSCYVITIFTNIFRGQDLSESESEFSEDGDNRDMESISLHMKGHNIHSVDFSSEAFRALPVEIQHEILLELRDTRKQSSWNRIHQMPQVNSSYHGTNNSITL